MENCKWKIARTTVQGGEGGRKWRLRSGKPTLARWLFDGSLNLAKVDDLLDAAAMACKPRRPAPARPCRSGGRPNKIGFKESVVRQPAVRSGGGGGWISKGW